VLKGNISTKLKERNQWGRDFVHESELIKKKKNLLSSVESGGIKEKG